MPKPHETLRVAEGRWRDAQEFERRYWSGGNRRNGLLKFGKRMALAALRPRELARILRFRDFYCGDGENFWWLDAFEGYRMLPRVVDCALEVGCGPHSNLRVISRVITLRDMTCVDPLMEDYLRYRRTWVADQARRQRIHTASGVGESLPFPPESFDLVVCINVLDHVQDMPCCLDEMRRVLRASGHLVLGQELTDARDFQLEDVRCDVGHPIKIERETLDALLVDAYTPVMLKVLPRGRGRNPRAHYGTYLMVGRKR